MGTIYHKRDATAQDFYCQFIPRSVMFNVLKVLLQLNVYF